MLSRNILKDLLKKHFYQLKQTTDPHVKQLRDFLKTYDNHEEASYDLVLGTTVFPPSTEEKLKKLFDIILDAKPAKNTTAAAFFNELERLVINSLDYTWEAEVLLAVKRYQKENPSSWFSPYPQDIEDLLKYIDENRSHMQIVKPSYGAEFSSEGLKRLLTVYKLIKKHKAKSKNDAERNLFASLNASLSPYQNLAEGLHFLENNKLYAYLSLELLNVEYTEALHFARALTKLSEHRMYVYYNGLLTKPANELKGLPLTYEEAADVLVTLKKQNYEKKIVELLAKYRKHFFDYKNFLGVMQTLIKNNLLSEELLDHLLSNSNFFEMKAANFMKLHKHQILSPENIAIVNINHKNADSLCIVLIALHKANILDDETKKLMSEITDKDLRETLKRVKLFTQANMFTKETFKRICDGDNEIKKSCVILKSLKSFDLLSQENYEFICQITDASDARERAINLLRGLASGNALNAETREKVKALCHPDVPHRYLAQFIAFINTVCEFHGEDAALPSTYIMQAFSHAKILGTLQIATLVGTIRNDANIATPALLRHFFDTCNTEGPTHAQKIQSLERYVNEMINPIGDDHPQEINYEQSVHAKSVEKSVVESLKKLNETYAEIDIEENYQKIVKFADSLTIENYPNPNIFPNDTIDQKCAADKEWNLKLNAAKSAMAETLSRLLNSIEPKTNTSIKKILALIWAAAHDGEKLIAPTEKDEKGQKIPKNIPLLQKNALYKFIQHLYEIHCGYALDAQGNHKGGKDISICVGGTINQLIAALDRMHEDVEIVFITRDTINAKARSLTLELIIKCLKTSSCSMAKEDYYRMSWDMTEEVKEYLKAYRFINKKGKALTLEDHLKEQLTDEFEQLKEDEELLNALSIGWQSMPLTLKNQFKPLVNKLVVEYIELARIEIKQKLVDSLSQDVTLKKGSIPKEIIAYLQSCGFQDKLKEELAQFTKFAPAALLTQLHESAWESIRLTKGTLEKIHAFSYKRAKDYDDLSKQWPAIQSLDEYLNAQEKIAFIESLKQNPLPDTPLAVLARKDLCNQIEDSDANISLKEIVEEGSPFLSTTLYLKKDKKVIATSALLEALSEEDKLFVADKRARDNSSLIILSSEREDIAESSVIEKRKLREIWRLRGEVEQQFGKECGLYYKRLFITVDPQRERLIKEIENIFTRALDEDWSLDAIKQELNNMGNEAQKHHESTSGFRFAGALFNKTCGFRIAIDKILAKFPIVQEEKHILSSKVVITRDLS